MFHVKRFNRISKGSKFIFVKMFTSLALGGIDVVWSIYMHSFGLSASSVGFITAFLVSLTLLATLLSTPILERFNKNRLLIVSVSVSILSYVLIGMFRNLYFFLGLAALLAVMSALRLTSSSIIFRDNTPDKNLNTQEGLYYALSAMGWMFGPLIAGFVLVKFGIPSVFFLGSALFAVSLVLFIAIRFDNIKKPIKFYNRNILKNISSYAKAKRLRLPYILSFGSSFWWSLIYIYMPIFIIDSGLGGDVVALFLAANAAPAIIMEYVIGRLSSSYGIRRFFALGFFSFFLAAIISFFMGDIYIQLILISLASVFGSVEGLQDTLFFKRVKRNSEEKYYPVFLTSEDTGSIAGKFSIATVLLFLPSNYAYLATAVAMFIFFLASLRIKNDITSE